MAIWIREEDAFPSILELDLGVETRSVHVLDVGVLKTHILLTKPATMKRKKWIQPWFFISLHRALAGRFKFDWGWANVVLVVVV